MRPRTRSIVNGREYFCREMYVHPHPPNGLHEGGDHVDDEEEEEAAAVVHAWQDGERLQALELLNCSGSSSISSCTSSHKSLDDDDDDDEEEVLRVRTCSHDRRISFDDEVNIVEIPSRHSYDEEAKRSMWYTAEDIDRMSAFD